MFLNKNVDFIIFYDIVITHLRCGCLSQNKSINLIVK